MCRGSSPTRVVMRILGIDPGYDRCGIAIVEGSGSRQIVVMSDCILPPRGAQEDRLAYVAQSVEEAIETYRPDALAIETLFFSVNKKTAIGVAEARGAVLAAAGHANVRIIEFSPQQVKIAVTGHGRADKAAVARMIPRIIALTEKKRFDDEIDAIAIAITAIVSSPSIGR